MHASGSTLRSRSLSSCALQYATLCSTLTWLVLVDGATLAETVLRKAFKTMPIPRESYVASTTCGRYGDFMVSGLFILSSSSFQFSTRNGQCWMILREVF
jgi:hypothetical protein